jgi:hypothetical protein
MGTNYGPDTKISIVTLQNPLYRMLMNDIAFIIDDKLVVLIEHQSTINENMPLRMLLYIARSYERWTKDKDIYRRNMLTIPRPEFIVLYNGKADMPDDMLELRLSDMFAGHDVKYPINLELTVCVYNINKGRNPEMAGRSTALNGYEEFISKAREYSKDMPEEQAIDRATEDCIKEGLLVNFFETYRSEVRNMLMTEWRLEDALEVSKMEGRKEGWMEGRMEGQKEVARRLIARGMSVEDVADTTGLTVDDVLRL